MSNVTTITNNSRLEFGRVSSGTGIISPDEARYMRDTMHFDRQRKISEANITRLANEMRNGRFTQGTQIYIAVLPNGAELIINGNHTLEAIVESGEPQVLTITRAAVADEDEAGDIYAVFDIQRVRSWRDSMRAIRADEGIPYADKVLSAMVIIERKFTGGTRTASRPERIGMMAHYRDAAQLFAGEVTTGAADHNVRLLTRAAVFSVVLETLRYQPSLASEFWGNVTRDDGLRKGMPERALLQWLRSNSQGSGGMAGQNDQARAAALAWNAAFSGQDRHHLKPRLMSSFYLLGTPWARGTGDQE